MKRILIAGLLFAVPTLAAPVSTPLAQTDKTVTGQEITAPEHPNVITSIVTFQPGEKTVVHKHPWPHYGYMLEGTLTIVNVETGKSFDLKPGAFLVEMQNTFHYGENQGNVPVRILIVDTVPQGVTTNTVPQNP